MRLLQLGGGATLLNELIAAPQAKATSEGLNGGEHDADGEHTAAAAGAASAAPFSAEATNGGDGGEHCNGVGAKSTSSGVTGELQV